MACSTVSKTSKSFSTPSRFRTSLVQPDRAASLSSLPAAVSRLDPKINSPTPQESMKDTLARSRTVNVDGVDSSSSRCQRSHRTV